MDKRDVLAVIMDPVLYVKPNHMKFRFPVTSCNPFDVYARFKSNCKEVSRNNRDPDNENLALGLIPNDLFFVKYSIHKQNLLKRLMFSTPAKSTEDIVLYKSLDY